MGIYITNERKGKDSRRMELIGSEEVSSKKKENKREK